MAETIIERVIERRHLLAHLGIVPAKFGVWMEDKKGNLLPFQMPKNPRQELAAILDLMGLEWKRRESRSALTPAQTGLDNLAKGEGKKARHYFYEVTPESVAQMVLWADRRNAARQVERLAADRLPATSNDTLAGTVLSAGDLRAFAEGTRAALLVRTALPHFVGQPATLPARAAAAPA